MTEKRLKSEIAQCELSDLGCRSLALWQSYHQNDLDLYFNLATSRSHPWRIWKDLSFHVPTIP